MINTNYNVKKNKLDTYGDSMVDTPMNRKIQAELDYWNKLLPSYVRLFGYQEDWKADKTVVVVAMAMEGCPEQYIGGNCRAKGWDKRNHPEGAISNFLGIGMNGEVEIGYKYLVDSVRHQMERCDLVFKRVATSGAPEGQHTHEHFINEDGKIITMKARQK